MRFGHVEFGVADLRRSRAFYEEVLGFRLVADQGGRFLWLERDGFEILLREGRGGGSTEIVFYTDRPAEEADRLRARGVAVECRAQCYHFTDPDGHRFQVVDPTADHSG